MTGPSRYVWVKSEKLPLCLRKVLGAPVKPYSQCRAAKDRPEYAVRAL